MKIIFKIHPITYIVTLLFILLGYFKLYCSFLLILFIHEMGHIFCAFLFKWHIKQIVCLPIGFLLKFEDSLNKPLIEEFFIAIAGIISQLIFISFIYNVTLIMCSNIIFLFNILPIYPLDGSKVINIFLNKVTSFKTSYFLTLLISFVSSILLLIFFIINKSFIPVITLILLLKNIIDLFYERNKLYTKFILERYLYNFKFKKSKRINSIYKIKRDYNHSFIINNHIYSEKEVLNKYFNSLF